jgi:hypothetical protein
MKKLDKITNLNLSVYYGHIKLLGKRSVINLIANL